MSDIHALSGAYAVDALDDIERASFERHLGGCATCRAEVASLRETAAALGDDVALAPPPELRAAVLDGITRVRPLPPVVPGGATAGRTAVRSPAGSGFPPWWRRSSSPSWASAGSSGSRGRTTRPPR